MRSLWSVAVLVTALALPRAARSEVSVKLGVINSMTGPQSAVGDHLSNGIKLAQEDLERRGVRLELVWEDDGGKPQAAVAAMDKFATRDAVAGVVGPYSTASVAAVSKLVERHHLPTLIPIAAGEDLTRQGNAWLFRLNAPAHAYVSVLIEAALTLERPRTLALLYENTDFGTSIARMGRQYAESKGLRVVASLPFSANTPVARAPLAEVKAQSPDLVLMAAHVADALSLMRQAREVGLSPRLFLGAGAGFSVSRFADERLLSRGVLTSAQWTADVPWPGAKEFAAKYRSRFGKAPTYHAACAYQAAVILASAASGAAGDREKVRAALRRGMWDGLMGPVKFSDYDGFTNQNNHVMLVEQVQDSGFTTVFPRGYASRDAIHPFPGWK
jgi:branched-chain amino acid transport system substrate-binding protein